MAPKRKKKSGSGAKSSEAAAAKKPDTTEFEDPLSTLLTNIQQISRSKTRCADLFQALLDSKCSVLESTPPKEEHVDCYWLLLTTHVISRMVQYLEKNQGEEDVAVILAALCHALATIVYSDKTKMDRCAQKTGAVRSALGQCIMSITLGSTRALQNLGLGPGDVEPALIRRAVWAATTALEMTVNHAPVKVTATSDGWNHAQHWLLQDAANLDVEHEEELSSLCEAVSRSLKISKEENSCIAALLETDAAPSPSGKRRRGARGGKEDTSSSPLVAHFQSLMKHQLAIHIDGRVSSRRWSSMTFVWFCQGQQRILEFVDSLLSDDKFWNTVLDCPAVIGPKDPPAAKSSPSKRSTRKKAVEPPKTTPPVHIPGNVSAVALASRLMTILSEAGTTCGSRAPSGGMDTYAAIILGLIGKGRGRASTDAVPSSWTRPDVRDLASVVIYKLVKSHTSCLRNNCTSPEEFGCVLVNDDTEGFGAAVPFGTIRPLRARFYPTVHKSLNSFCYAAASSGPDPSRIGDSNKRLLAITSAFILASAEQVRNIVDAKLYGLAIGELTECLRNIVSDDDRASTQRAMEVENGGKDARQERLNKKYGLDNPLPVPTLSPASPAKPSRKKKKKTPDNAGVQTCTFGGMFPQQTSAGQEQQRMTDEELLSLLICAVRSTSDESPPPAAMFTELIKIVRCCYDLKEPAFEVTTGDSSEAGNSKRKGRKRTASSKMSQGKKKRKKGSSGAAEDTDDDAISTRTPKGMKSPRAGLASDALTALKMFLSIVPPSSSASHARRELRVYLRDTLTTEHVCSVVDLSRMINEALLESHLASKAQKNASRDGATTSFFSASHSNDFRPYEKLLWTAHIQLCQTLGLGRLPFVASQKPDRPVLGDTKRRLSVFQSITSSTNGKSTEPDKWPLSLDATQHALVASNLSNEPIPDEGSCDPERFIAQSFMSSIVHALDNPSILTNSEWYSSSLVFNDGEKVVKDSYVPLSLRDARLFVLAVSRLPMKEQQDFMDNFVGTMSSAIGVLKSCPENSTLVAEDADVSGFLARVVTVCATLVNVVTVGSRLRDALVSQVGSTHYGMPNFVPRKELTPESRMEDGDWYRSETSFVGLFSDWESPVVPSVTGALQLRHLVSEDTISNLRSLHEAAIQLGFRSARHDRCHLLFAAWNASGRSASWESSPETLSRSDTSANDEDSATRRLLDMRDDVCVLHREIHGNEDLFPDSLLTRFLTERGSGRRPGLLRTKLESMMTKAEAIVDSILAAYPPLDESNDMPLVSFALLEAISAYIAFIMAAHTRSIDNFLSRGHRQGGGMSDDDDASSVSDYHEGTDDDRVETLMNLNEVCATFGAAPMHPDWLDVGCYLRDGITAEAATKIAHRGLICLEKLCSAAREAHVKFMSKAMAELLEDEPNRELKAELALNLCLSRIGRQDGESDLGNVENIEQWDDSIASVCGIDVWKVKMFSRLRTCKNAPHAAETFCQNSAQRIMGSLRIRKNSFEDWGSSLPEYRACGDWELLLSEALLGSCADISLPEEMSKVQPSVAFLESFALAGRWFKVQEAAVSSLMPVAALLRFGLSEGLGRNRHPLLCQVTSTVGNTGNGNSSTSLSFCEPLPASSRARSNQANDAVVRTLSALLLIPASNDHSDIVKPQCTALASNLMIDSKAFEHLKSIESLRVTFNNIHRIRDFLANLEAVSDKQASSVSFVLERLSSSIEDHGKLRLASDKASSRLEGLMSFLGGRPFSVDNITKNGVDHTEILSVGLQDDTSWLNVQDEGIAELVGILSCSQWDPTVETWSRVSDVLSSLARSEIDASTSNTMQKDTPPLSQRIVKALNKADDSYLPTIVQWIVSDPSVDPKPDVEVMERISLNLCTFFSWIVGGDGGGGDFKSGKILLDSLMQTIDSWLWSKASKDVMSLLSLLGTRYNTLGTIGSRILDILTAEREDKDKDCMAPVEVFFRFLHDLECTIANSGETNTDSPSQKDLPVGSELRTHRESGNTTALADTQSRNESHSFPTACSFALQSGFHQQHWYNCYTCGLVWDKGCCTLCALRCHQDHDVSYSRYSSFFCDCGGEAPTEDEDRSPCKCLATVESQEVARIFKGLRWPVIDTPTEVWEDTDSSLPSDGGDSCVLAVSIASSCLREFVRPSLNDMKAEAASKSWTKVLFDVLQLSHERRQQVESTDDSRPEPVDMPTPPKSKETKKRAPSISERNGKVLSLQTLSRKSLLPIRGTRSGTFQLNLSVDSITDRVKRAALSRNGVRRRAVVTDRRGRMIVAEPCSLLFCAALPSVNVRYEKSPELPFNRGQMSILGSHSTDFNIVGIDFCPDNERHLAVWGTAEASIMILNSSCDKVERTIELVFSLESDEVDYLVKCIWVPGSQTMVAVVCGLFVKIFDIRQAEGDKVNSSLASYGLAIEALLRDAALVPSSESALGDEDAPRRTVAKTVKLYLLLDIGQILDINLCFDDNSQLEVQGDMYIESGEGITFPVPGVRINHSGQPASEGTRMRSMGEASSLTFLPFSGILLYACASSPVLALLLDATGSISGSFELLPYVVKSETLCNGSDGYSIHGPFTQFTELGCVEYDHATYFRVACVGKSSRTSQPKLLCVDFNEDAVRVKELAWCTAVGIPSMSLPVSSSFDGLAAFSSLALTSTGNEGVSLKRSDFVERPYLCAVASNGAMVMFGEQVDENTPAFQGRSGYKQPTFPLTLFERLVNVSDAEDLVFAGDGVGSAEDLVTLKSKLSPNSSTYFMCPSRDGSTITISLHNSHEWTARSHQAISNESVDHTPPATCERMQNDLVVVAVRLLVGSTTTEFIPKYVSVEGRRIWLQPDMKKHYDLPLTAEEIASSLRNGFVSLGIGPSFDSGNNPLIDAIEVYAVKREQIRHWLPLTCSEMNEAQTEEAVTDESADGPETPVVKNEVALNVATLTHLLHVLKPTSDVSPEAFGTIRQLALSSALEDGGETRQSLITLLSCIEPDSCRRKNILDEGTLIGVLKALRSVNDDLVGQQSGRDTDESERKYGWDKARQMIRNSLRVSVTVAGERPGNYVQVLEHALKEEPEDSSIAVLACSILNKCLTNQLECQDLIPDLVELCLSEALLFHGRKNASKGAFASFEVLKEMLGSSDDEFVKACCEAILGYWKQHLSKSDPVISYQCDGCSLFPISGARYTFPDGGSTFGQDNDIDLCSECYSIGRHFAERNRYSPRIHVKISGKKTVGKVSKLSCARLAQMKRISIPTTWLASTDPAASKDSSEMPPASINVEDFSSIVFNDLVSLISGRLAQTNPDFSLFSFQYLMDVVLNIVRCSSDDSIMLIRAKLLAESILARVPSYIDAIAGNDEMEEVARSVLVICLQGLSRLAALKDDHSGCETLVNWDNCSVEDVSPSKSKDKTDPRFVCEVHGVPAVRRRCSHDGPNKNRRFYVCGMDRNSRCGYFKWADSDDGGSKMVSRSEDAKCEFSDEIGKFIWSLLNKADGESESRPICARLYVAIENDTHDRESGALSLPVGVDVEVSGPNGTEKTTQMLPSRYGPLVVTSDYVDGVFCSLEKLRGTSSEELLKDCCNDDSSPVPRENTVFTATLDLLAYVAGISTEANKQSRGEEAAEVKPSDWFPLLCEIISCSKSPRYRLLAKRALRRLCGGNKIVYQSVRDHFVFMFQFQELLRHAQPALLAAVNVKEQARQCGMNWRNGRKATFRDLPAGGLIGTNDLVSEDCVTIERSSAIGRALDELANASKNRAANWRNFCSLTTLPAKRANQKDDVDLDDSLIAASPIVSLVWIASALSGENQVKVLRLVASALSTPNDTTLARRLSISKGPSSLDADIPKDCKALLRFCTPSSLPESILLEGDKALLADEVHAFVVQFVLGGNSFELRKAGGDVSIELCRKIEGTDLEWLLSQLTDRALVDLPEMGSNCTDLFRVLRVLASSGVSVSSPVLASMARKAATAFTDQLRLIGNEKSVSLFTSQGDNDSERALMERYDLAGCAHCHRLRDPPPLPNDSNQVSPSTTAATQNQVDKDVPMLPEQFRPFVREALETSVDVSLSTEFSMYVQLKCRLALSDIHVSIGDPRGRYVKTIAVYFSPRQVSDANVLKSEEYASTWQRCATISLSRGATRASCAISPPVIAANLRIEYLEFYERPGGSRAADGSLLLHCPRCTRVVSNAHGVCGHCGEVAFQCRKCRHINYLRLDAFLCVECGYCSTASFSYDLTCGSASNAVAVVDDDSYERSIKVLRVATKLHEELRTTLSDRVRPSSGKRSLSVQKYGPSLKRTFVGELPRISKDKAGTSESSSSLAASLGGDDSNPSAAGNRARSLLRLARQLRNDSSDRSRISDVLVRQSLIGEDIDEMESDVVGFISSDADGSTDPLSRLVASIQGRSARSSGRRDASSRTGGSGGGAGGSGNQQSSEASAKAASEECDRLYSLMREAEQECYELRRRINAWKRLENDALADLGSAEPLSYSFSPSQCTKCRGPVALSLLNLFMALFESNTKDLESAITQNFIRALFDESADLDDDLFNAKRATIANLATKSKVASKIILEQLRLRLNGSRDGASAEILGKIIARADSGEEFVTLAGDILDSGY